MSAELDNARAALNNPFDFSGKDRALRDLIAEYERVTNPPADDEREALEAVIKNADFTAPDESHLGVIEYWIAWKRHMASQVLAAGFRRRGPITDDRTRPIACPHWSPGLVTMRARCTACETAEAAR